MALKHAHLQVPNAITSARAAASPTRSRLRSLLPYRPPIRRAAMQSAPAPFSSGGGTPVPLPAARLLRPPPFPHNRHHRRSPPKLLALTARPPLHPAARRAVLFTPRAHGCGHGHHHHHHGRCHGHHGVDVHGAGWGAAVMRAARAIGLAGMADTLRENVQVCCASLGLLLVAAACPHVAVLSSVVGRLQSALIAVAYPLVGV